MKRVFRNFDDVLNGLRELRDLGWQIRLEPIGDDRRHYRRETLQLLRPNDMDWRWAKDPLEALLAQFHPDAPLDHCVEKKSSTLGLRNRAGHWVYALAADNPALLDTEVHGFHLPRIFELQRGRLLTACGFE